MVDSTKILFLNLGMLSSLRILQCTFLYAMKTSFLPSFLVDVGSVIHSTQHKKSGSSTLLCRNQWPNWERSLLSLAYWYPYRLHVKWAELLHPQRHMQ
jgi:hypothetical protein